MIAVVASPAVRRRLPLPDGRTAIVIEHGAMTLYSYGLEIAWGPEIEVHVEPRAGRAATAAARRGIDGVTPGTASREPPHEPRVA